MFGLGWLALALLTARVVGGAAKLGGPEDPCRKISKPDWTCVQCGRIGNYGEEVLRIFVDDLEPYCPECGWFLNTGH